MKKDYITMSELHIWPILSKDFFKHCYNLGHVIRMYSPNFPYCQGNEGAAIKSFWNTNAEARFAK